MKGFLLDTNVLSEFNRRRDPDPRVKRWLETTLNESLYASVLTLGEIRMGIELMPPSKNALGWRNGFRMICRTGLKAESFRLMSQSPIAGDYFQRKRSQKDTRSPRLMRC